MESKKSKDILRKHKKPRPPSSSDSSSSSDSDSGSSSDSFSSSSSSKKAIRRKAKKLRTNRRLSSSSEDERIRKHEKHSCHKKLEAKKSHLKRKLKEAKAKKRAFSPSMRRRSLTPSQKMKKLAMSMAEKKHHILVSKERMREKEREREREREKEGREKEREKLRVRERERIRSRSPKKLKSRSPTKSSRGRDIKRKSPVDKHHMSPREKIICQIRRDRSPVERKKEIRRRHDESRERERRDRERAEREAARNKEREEALARCQERQRERERLAREKLKREKEKEYKPDRLLPRPAEREMAIAAARASSRERSLEREPHRTHLHTHSRPREPVYERGYEREREYMIPDHRIEKEERREHDREYLVLRRREVESPSSVTAHFNERPRGSEREMYTEEQKYEREHTYIPRNYISPTGEPHRREPNWERDHHEVPREREIDHAKLYPSERPAGTSREWSGREEDWRPTQKDRQWQENWPRTGEPPEKSWDSEENFRPRQQHEWEDPRIKHDAHPREEHPPPQPHISRRWPQEWRGRPNEDRPGHQGPLPPFHHNPIVPHQMEYPHERTEPMPIYRRQHPPKPHVQPPHIPHPGGFHIRPHFPPKRQMTYINPNQQAPHIMPNQNVAIHVPKIISTPMLQVNPLNSQTQPVNQSAASGTNQSITAIDKTIVLGPEDKGKEKQDQQLNIKEIDANTGSKEAEQSTRQQTLLEEPIRDDLSEISDDADEILNKDGEANKFKNEENWDSDSNEIPETTVKKDDDFSATSDVHSSAITGDKEDENRLDEVATAISVENNEEAQSSSISVPEESVKSVATPTEQEVKDMSINDDILDFEEISDGELEEEEKTKVRNLSDALGVDWASLVEESKFKPIPIEKQTTAKQKWQPHRIILDIGISFKYAGEEFAKKMLDEAKRKLNEEQEENKNIDGKLEIKEEDISIIDNDLMMDMKMPASEIKVETKENTDETKQNPYLHKLACVQVATIKKEHDRKMLVFNACGPNSRALSARRDLKLRRQLCGLPIKEIGFQRPVNNHLRELALKAFQRTLTEVK